MKKITEQLDDIWQSIEDGIKYIESVNQKRTIGGEFVPDGKNLYATDDAARFSAENPEVDRAIKHEIYELDRRIKGE